ncbi:hypothetical protein QA600_04590 [Natronococcus sp. A-GB1]|uniref:hypothetical protein n=1 Tax=Natronococcus sp. A-GB1 TaxID=3037648 RepID=UPI00241C1AAC|nr:hypothetical protein [Natronococcus sp. A-GB1]MDG5758613.1 hypothetical protein [Natronococcus sp. A-GB1]
MSKRDRSDDPGIRGGEYAECNAPFVDYDEVPDYLAAEVDPAFEDGAYETDGELRYRRAVGDGVPLWKNDGPHDHEGKTRRLSFERRTAFASPRDVTVRNETDETIAATVTVTDGGDGELLLEEGTTVAPDDWQDVPTVDAFGTYDVAIELEDGRRETKSWEVPAPKVEVMDGVTVSITDDKISMSPLVSSYDYERCSSQWDRREPAYRSAEAVPSPGIVSGRASPRVHTTTTRADRFVAIVTVLAGLMAVLAATLDSIAVDVRDD